MAATLVCELLLPRPDRRILGRLIVLTSIGAVRTATTGRILWLVNRSPLWLGSVSYALYLTHQNIGYWRFHHLSSAGWSLPGASLASPPLAIARAQALRNLVEEP